ncbi:hypothetical protein ACRZ5S_19990 [Vibrio scophthalmi]
MSNIISTLGMAIIASKYTLILLIAGLTLFSGGVASESTLILGFNADK